MLLLQYLSLANWQQQSTARWTDAKCLACQSPSISHWYCLQHAGRKTVAERGLVMLNGVNVHAA